MAERLDGTVALVTGASSGIGEAIPAGAGRPRGGGRPREGDQCELEVASEAG